jgi:hypothetical protein
VSGRGSGGVLVGSADDLHWGLLQLGVEEGGVVEVSRQPSTTTGSAWRTAVRGVAAPVTRGEEERVRGVCKTKELLGGGGKYTLCGSLEALN